MKITVSISMDGKDQWTERANGFGQTVKRSHTFEIDFSDELDQHEMISSSIERLIRATESPRPAFLLADLVTTMIETSSERKSRAEIAFHEAAEAVLEHIKDSAWAEKKVTEESP